MIHREKEFTQTIGVLGIANSFLHGPVGSGKTLLGKKEIKNYNATQRKSHPSGLFSLPD